MGNEHSLQEAIDRNGYALVSDVFDSRKINDLLSHINEADANKATFRKTTELFAIRQFLKEIPQTAAIIFSPEFIQLLEQAAGPGFFVTKSVYFDKPPHSNWFVSFHQDLTISADQKKDIPGFGPWTIRQEQYGVQPPLHFLEEAVTARIHLDDTTRENGALQVIPGSHLSGIVRPENADLTKKEVCPVARGGVMFMKPLLLHASSRTTNDCRRRVIHIEFNRKELPEGLKWSERLDISKY